MFGARHRVAAQAAYQIAEINRVRGDLEQAAAWYREVIRDGGDPMPGLALLEVARGDPGAALDSLRDAIADTDDAHEQAGLLPVYVEIALAIDDQTGAAEAAESLTRIANETDADVHTAWAMRARGQVAFADRRIPEAVRSLRDAATAWRDLSVPYELARTRVDLGMALERRGDSGAALVALEAARAVFEELGATPDVRRVEGLLHPEETARPGGLTDRELEVLRMLTTGATNRAIAADLVVSERTIDRHVSNIFTKLGVSSRAAATAFAIRNGLA
jgi:DNA-binding NarL/FixJ family response regulator